MKKLICIFAAYFYPHLGGVERYTHQLSLRLLEQGYEVMVVTSHHDDLPYEDEFEGMQIIRLPAFNFISGRLPIPKFNRQFRKSIHMIRSRKPDYFIINARFYIHSLIGAALAKKEAKPALLIEHGTGHFTFSNIIVDKIGEMYEHAITWMLKKKVTAFYGVSKACNTWLEHFNITAEGVFYNGIDTDYQINKTEDIREKYGLSPNTILITYAGRLIEEKGVKQLNDAFNLLLENHSNIALIIAGDGPLRAELESKATEYTCVVGQLKYDEVMNLMRQTDIFVLPTLFPEGLPTSILEAGLNNCAVIATPKGGTPEVITNESFGKIIWPLESGALVNALEDYISNEQIRIDAANALHGRVQALFSWEELAKNVIMTLENSKVANAGGSLVEYRGEVEKL